MAALPWGRELTRDDLATLPDDGHRYELLDGSLLVTPAPGPVHQVVAFELAKLLDAAVAGTDLLVLLAPVEVVLSDLVVLQPDVVVARREDIDARGVNGIPLLVVDPDAPALTAWRLENASYAVEATVTGDDVFRAFEPLVIELRPSELLRHLRA